MHEFYEEPRQLNVKKVIIICLILVIILISLIVVIARKISSPKENDNTKKPTSSTVFNSPDHSVSIELPNTFNLKSYNSNLNYLIELRSKDNLNIFLSKETTTQNQNLANIIEADKLAFLSNFDSYSNLSDTKELSVNNHLAYTYSFHYLDKNLNQAFYLQVTWLQIENTFYIFDIEFPLNDLAFNTNITSTVLSSFKVNP